MNGRFPRMDVMPERSICAPFGVHPLPFTVSLRAPDCPEIVTGERAHQAGPVIAVRSRLKRVPLSRRGMVRATKFALQMLTFVLPTTQFIAADQRPRSHL